MLYRKVMTRYIIDDIMNREYRTIRCIHKSRIEMPAPSETRREGLKQIPFLTRFRYEHDLLKLILTSGYLTYDHKFR